MTAAGFGVSVAGVRGSAFVAPPQSTPLSLFDAAPAAVSPEYERGATIDERFARFHADNEWVYVALERLAVDLYERGRRFGVKALVEVVRWEYSRATTSDDGLKVNNSFTSRYARLLLERHPEFDGFIETRELRSL